MPTIRMISPASSINTSITLGGQVPADAYDPGSPDWLGPGATPVVVNGRKYSAVAGSAIDVPDFDAVTLGANGFVRVAVSGPTSARTTGFGLGVGTQFFDTTLNELIVFNGATWRSPVTGASV
jgi:hypothetical protein